MSWRVIIQANPVAVRVCPAGYDAFSSTIFDNYLDERAGALRSVSGRTIVPPNGGYYPIYFGRNFVVPPILEFIILANTITGEVAGSAPGITQNLTLGGISSNSRMRVFPDHFQVVSAPVGLDIKWRAYR